MLRRHYLSALGLACMGGACAMTPDAALMPDNVPVLYAAPEVHQTEDLTCDNMQLEFAYLNAGLGDYPTDTPPPDNRTMKERAAEKLEDLIMDALTDQIDPAIQAYRILTDAGETERKLAQAKRRGRIRRAYVMGHMDAVDCARDKDTILIAAKLASGEVMEIREAKEAGEVELALAEAVDGPPVQAPETQMAAANPQSETAPDVEIEYLIVIELEPEPVPEQAAQTELAAIAKPPPLSRADIEDEVRALAGPNVFDTPWEEGEEPAPPPDAGVPIAGAARDLSDA